MQSHMSVPGGSDRDLLVLFPIFDAIMSTGSLSRASKELGITQPAVSQALGRLRKLVNDPLFENTGRGMRPTPRALAMSQHVRGALFHANAVLAPREVDIKTVDRAFTLDIGGGFDALIVPHLVVELSTLAPGIRLLVSNVRGRDLLEELRRGETHLAFDFEPSAGDGIRHEVLGHGPAVVVARPNHPALRKGLTEELYLELNHVALAWTRSSNVSGVGSLLEREGKYRRVTTSVPTLAAAAEIVSKTDLLATLGDFTASLLIKRFDLQIHALPFALAPVALYQLWHTRFDGDPAHAWLRDTVRALTQSLARQARTQEPK